jgi:S-methylmethionine-dependent homocysteine/selenocysteine methylase
MDLIEINPFSAAKENNKPLILDGAMGSLLQQRGYVLDDKIWGTNINKLYPEEVLKIHNEYIEAGANIITSNTFRTNPAAFWGSDYEFNPQYVINAVNLAKKAVGKHNVLIAGSNAPAEDCYKKRRDISYDKLKINHINHIDLLVDSGVDLILNETQSHFDEIKIICEQCHNIKVPFIVSLYCTKELKLLSGENIKNVINYIQWYAPLAIGFNCIQPNIFMSLFSSTLYEKINWGFYLNCGSGNYTDKIIECGINPSNYIKFVKESLKYKPSFIGACCGSNPEHIKAIKKLYE